MKNKDLPTVSILIPTLNAARVLSACLKSINRQDYPAQKLEVIVADGGSTDKTLAIAEKYKARICLNPLKTGEAGKAVALKQAKGELVALIDSDNLLPSRSWLKKMVAPFIDPTVLGSEPWQFTYRKKDTLINRYCALLGMNDPYCLFVGNYDRKSVLSGKWTGLKMEEEDKGSYLKIKIEKGILPTIGANGTIWQTRVVKRALGKNKYLVDFEILYDLVKKRPFYFAKVKVGIIHLYCHQLKDFYRKQKRRARDFLFAEAKGSRKATYQRQASKQIYFAASTLLAFPLFFQALKGYLKKPDLAWFFHPLACWLTLWVYGTETILAKIKKTEMSRADWGQ